MNDDNKKTPFKLAKTLQEDPLYKKVKEENIKKWEEKNGPRFDEQGLREEFINYNMGNPADRKAPTLEGDTVQELNKRHPGLVELYQKKIYEKPRLDPEIQQLEEQNLKEVNKEIKAVQDGKRGEIAQREYQQNPQHETRKIQFRIGSQNWDKFVRSNHQKAEAYKDYRPVKRSLQRQIKQKVETTKLQRDPVEFFEKLKDDETYVKYLNDPEKGLKARGFDLDELTDTQLIAAENNIKKALAEINTEFELSNPEIVESFYSNVPSAPAGTDVGAFDTGPTDTGSFDTRPVQTKPRGELTKPSTGANLAKSGVKKLGGKALKKVAPKAVAAVAGGPVGTTLAVVSSIRGAAQRIGSKLGIDSKTIDGALTTAAVAGAIFVRRRVNRLKRGLRRFDPFYQIRRAFRRLLIISATWTVVFLVSLILLIAFILFIINSGAYIVPPGGFGGSSGVQSSPYIDIDKEATPPGPFENSDLPQTITYSITITALQGTLTSVSVVDTCRVISDTNVGCPAVSGIQDGDGNAYNNFGEVSQNLTISPLNSFSLSYTRLFSGNYTDSAIIDIFTVNANHSGQAATAADSATVIFGDPPAECPSIWPIVPGPGETFYLTQGAYTPSGWSHNTLEAIDIDTNQQIGKQIVAGHSGTVITSGTSSCLGNYIEIESVCVASGAPKNFFSRYAHLTTRGVNVGAPITIGQSIGTSGNSGSCTTGPHLHYGFRYASGPAGGPGSTYLQNHPYMTLPFLPKTVTRGCTNCNVTIP